MLAQESGFANFLTELFRSSRVTVASLAEFTSDERELAARCLAEFEARYRNELPHSAPAFCDAAALWGAERFYRACQCLVFRDVSPQAIEAELGQACPAVASAPSVAYSVDLTWRFLPDLLKLAKGLANDEPLVMQLQRWAMDWPLSSIGVPNVKPVDVAGFIDDPCLRALYVDRIIARRDISRLHDVRVRDAARKALGAFPELAPELAALVMPKE